MVAKLTISLVQSGRFLGEKSRARHFGGAVDSPLAETILIDSRYQI